MTEVSSVAVEAVEQSDTSSSDDMGPTLAVSQTQAASAAVSSSSVADGSHKQDEEEDDGSDDSEDGVGPALPTKQTETVTDASAKATEAIVEKKATGRKRTAVQMTESDSSDITQKRVAKRIKRKAKRDALSGHEKLQLSRMPSAHSYECSYMHRSTVTHVCFAPHCDFLVSGSRDGVVKFWKKTDGGIEFAKEYAAHLSRLSDMRVSADGQLLCTVAVDSSVCIFDVGAFDMIRRFDLADISSADGSSANASAVRLCLWLQSTEPTLALTARDSGTVYVLKALKSEEYKAVTGIHSAPIVCLDYSPNYECVISADKSGRIEYWNPFVKPIGSQRAKRGALGFDMLLQTDCYKLAKEKCFALTLRIGKEHFALRTSDSKVHVFELRTGRIILSLDESLERSKQPADVDTVEFGRQVAVEREVLEKLTRDPFSGPVSDVVFDESGRFLLLSSMCGVKVVCVRSGRVVRTLGTREVGCRFLRLALFQGVPSVSGQSANDLLDATRADPTLFCSAFKKSLFFMFSTRMPLDFASRDVVNERPTQLLTKVATDSRRRLLAKGAVIRTTFGDIHVKLFGDECPKAVENFSVHCSEGYFDGVVFHRVIRNFMLQTGDPKGDGTGGESIYGSPFEDEFAAALRHDRPGTVSMANSGPNTNGSQFFITTVASSWLDDVHSVFGRVSKGMDVVNAIEKVRTDKNDIPREAIKILSTDIIL